MPIPDHFVIVGAQRCGTTYLYRLLDEHPGIEMAKPMRPEPKFFLDDERYARGLDHYESELFSEAPTLVRGEKSTSYIESEVAAQRIHATLPDATVVVVLRDPVRRAVSNYRFSAQHGNEPLALDEALRASETADRDWDRSRFSVSPFAYLPRGRYVEYLERYARFVPREQTEVVFFEELVADAAVVARLYASLGVDASFRPAGLGVVANASDAGDDPLPPDIEARLRDYYCEPNRQLAKYLGRNVPWPTA